jgi:hypothetical protein
MYKLSEFKKTQIRAQISKTHRYVLPGRNICCFIGYESETIISVAYSYKLLRYESDFYDINVPQNLKKLK